MKRRRHSTKKVSKEIPFKTFSDWKEPTPGYLEIDFVVHGGGSMSGEYLHTLVATDVCTGWIEAVPLLAREQKLVVEGLNRIREEIPMRVLGIDSDNDGAFINETLLSYCQKAGITFTRCRPHHSNDQAWIEQKNGAVIRRMVGHDRYSGIVAGQVLAQLLESVRLYVNFFQPSFKLRERVREGGKVKKTYHPPATPLERLLLRDEINAATKEKLQAQQSRLDPVGLLHRIRQGQAALAALNAGKPVEGPGRESLNEFLAALPLLWEKGEARPTHRKATLSDRYWRTREDPFKSVWTDILMWLQDDPDATAKTLLQKLIVKYPGQYDHKVLRTLQRRVGEWRGSMAHKLVFGGEEKSNIHPVTPEQVAEKAALQLATLTSALSSPQQTQETPP